MTTPAISEVLRRAGLSVSVTPDSALRVTPASHLTRELRALIRANKDELVAWIDRFENPDAAGKTDETDETGKSQASQGIAPDELVTEPPISSMAVEPPNPDRWCWPLSSAMNTAEIATMEVRLHLFSIRGLDVNEAEALADKLVLRDREGDERRICLECQHLQVQPVNHWRDYAELRCGNWLAAGLCFEARDAGLSHTSARQLQHCDGFRSAT